MGYNMRLSFLSLILLLYLGHTETATTTNAHVFQISKAVGTTTIPSPLLMDQPLQHPLLPLGNFGFTEDFDYPHKFATWGEYAYLLEQGRIRVLSYTDPTNTRVVSEIFHPSPLQSFTNVELSPDGSRLIVSSKTGRYPDASYQ
jgi:hypothetical protein